MRLTFAALRKRGAQFVSDVLDAPPEEIAGRVTLLYLLLRPVGADSIRFGATALAALGLLSPRAAQSYLLWVPIALLTTLRLEWPSDNHDYLLAYWCWSVALSMRARERIVALAWNARALLGTVFCAAAIWKGILSSDYRDGTFFTASLVLDGRFRDFVLLLGVTDSGTLLHDMILFRGLLRNGLPGDTATLIIPQALSALAFGLTWATLIIEAVIGVMFVLPKNRYSAAADWLLLAFVLATYAVAPVVGFGWLLLILGLTQCATGRRITRLAYLVSFSIVLSYAIIPLVDKIAEVREDQAQAADVAATVGSDAGLTPGQVP